MREKVVKHWDRNLLYLVEQLSKGACPKENIPRHCRDFLAEYRKVIAEEIIGTQIIK